MTTLTMDGSLHGLAAGTALTHTPTNNTGAMGTPATAITLVSPGTVKAHANGVRFEDPVGASSVARWDWHNLLNGTQFSFEAELDPVNDIDNEVRMAVFRNVANTADIGYLQLTSARILKYYNSANSLQWTAGTALPSSAGSRVHLGLDLSNGAMTVNVYTGADGKSESAAWTVNATIAVGGTGLAIGGVRFGSPSSGGSWRQVFRNVRISDGTTAPHGPAVSAVSVAAPRLISGIDLTGLVTGGVAPYSITAAAQLDGDPITGSVSFDGLVAVFTEPPRDVTIRYTVTDSGGRNKTVDVEHLGALGGMPAVWNGTVWEG